MAVPAPEFEIIGIGVIYIRFHVCRSWGVGGNGVADKEDGGAGGGWSGEQPLNSCLWKQDSGNKLPPVFV